jgi:hypothetical protein
MGCVSDGLNGSMMQSISAVCKSRIVWLVLSRVIAIPRAYFIAPRSDISQCFHSCVLKSAFLSAEDEMEVVSST